MPRLAVCGFDLSGGNSSRPDRLKRRHDRRGVNTVVVLLAGLSSFSSPKSWRLQCHNNWSYASYALRLRLLEALIDRNTVNRYGISADSPDWLGANFVAVAVGYNRHASLVALTTAGVFG